MLLLLFHKPGGLRVAFMDEARVGLVGQQGRRLSLRGVKPLSKRQCEYKWKYLWAAVCPGSGSSVLMETDGVCTDTFNLFLKEVSKEWAGSRVLLVLDGAGYHRAKAVELPANVRLLFLPPYSPELNPVERLWQEMRTVLKGVVFNSLDQAVAAAEAKLKEYTGDKMIQLCEGYNFLGPLAFTG